MSDQPQTQTDRAFDGAMRAHQAIDRILEQMEEKIADARNAVRQRRGNHDERRA